MVSLSAIFASKIVLAQGDVKMVSRLRRPTSLRAAAPTPANQSFTAQTSGEKQSLSALETVSAAE